jgi:hypothetical protein
MNETIYYNTNPAVNVLRKKIFDNRWLAWAITVILSAAIVLWGTIEYTNMMIKKDILESNIVEVQKKVIHDELLTTMSTYRSVKWHFDIYYPKEIGFLVLRDDVKSFFGTFSGLPQSIVSLEFSINKMNQEVSYQSVGGEEMKIGDKFTVKRLTYPGDDKRPDFTFVLWRDAANGDIYTFEMLSFANKRDEAFALFGQILASSKFR